MIKNTNFITFLILSTVFLSSCSTVQEAFIPQNKNSSQEFLVEKKFPLSIPPNFEDLPIPSNERIDEEREIDNIESLITKNNNEKFETF